jgi:sodium-dependent dicarboxylate transporter 2/3/5
MANAINENKVDWKRIFFILLGLTLFFVVYYMPSWKDAVDPTGKAFALTREGKASIALVFGLQGPQHIILT